MRRFEGPCPRIFYFPTEISLHILITFELIFVRRYTIEFHPHALSMIDYVSSIVLNSSRTISLVKRGARENVSRAGNISLKKKNKQQFITINVSALGADGGENEITMKR